MTGAQDWLGNNFSFSYGKALPSELGVITSPLVTTNFGYDNMGNLTGETVTGDYQASWRWAYNADALISSEPQGSVSYDSNDRVTNPGGYSYAANGEFQYSTGGQVTYSYNTSLELTSVTNSGNQPVTVTSFGYNADGQRCWEANGSVGGTACSSAPSGATEYSWDPYGFLCSIGPTTTSGGCPTNTSPTSGDTNFTYGPDGLRTAETPPSGQSETFTYDLASRSSQPLVLADGTYAYVYGPANFGAATPPLEEISLSTGNATDIVSDPTGPRATLTNAGVAGTYSYGTYGQQTTTGSSVSFGFQGAYQDADGLLYMVNRYYDPTTGQFLCQPYEFAGDDPVNSAGSSRSASSGTNSSSGLGLTGNNVPFGVNQPPSTGGGGGSGGGGSGGGGSGGGGGTGGPIPKVCPGGGCGGGAAAYWNAYYGDYGPIDEAMAYFYFDNLSAVDAAAIVGNLLAESGLNSWCEQSNSGCVPSGGGPGYGIAQWTYDSSRYEGLLWIACAQHVCGWSAVSQNLPVQLDYVWWELTNTETGALWNLASTQDLYWATWYVEKYYETPAESLGQNSPSPATPSFYVRYSDASEALWDWASL